MKSQPRRRTSRPIVTLVALLLAIVAGGIGIASYLFYFRPVAQAIGSATGQVVPRPAVVTTEAEASGGPLKPVVSVPASPAPTPPSLSGSDPINVLLLGSDTDAKFVGDYNTQIMIVVSILPAQKKVSMLSIPRDLWVQIPGYGAGKIGVAYGAGGLALARQTIETDFGIPIHYYAWVGLDGFIKVIDTLGGVDLDLSHPVVDDSYPDDVNSPDPYAYRRLYIPAGPQHLDGARALEYVRSRHGDLIGDFGRSQRQQQLLDALRSDTNGKDVVTRLPRLANDLKDSIRTDMTLTDLLKFAAFAEQIKSEPVQQHTLTPPTYSSDGMSGDGQSVVIPNWREIRPLVDSLFGLRTASTLPMTVPSLGLPPPPPFIPVAKPAAASAAETPEASGTAAPAQTAVNSAAASAGAPVPSGTPRPLVAASAKPSASASGAPAASVAPASAAPVASRPAVGAIPTKAGTR